MSLPAGFTFAYPWLLLLLLALPVLALMKGGRGAAPAVIFSSVHPLRSLGRARRSRVGALLASLVLLALALLIVGLARPRLGKVISRVEASGIDIMLAIDVSSSMIAEDFTLGGERVNRLVAVKDVTEKFITGRPNDRIGLVAFAGHPYVVSPLTLDHDWLLKNLERVRMAGVEDPNIEDGTAIGSAIASAANRLRDHDSKSRIIVLLTDGENTAGKVKPVDAAEAAHLLGVKLYTIGAGTRGHAPVPVRDMFGRRFYQNREVRVDEATLRKIAEVGHGHYYRATDTKTLTEIFEQIDKLEKSTVEMSHYQQYRELFPWFLAAGFGLLAIQLVLAETAGRRLP